MYALSWDEILVDQWRLAFRISLFDIFVKIHISNIIEEPDPFKIYVASRHSMVAKYSLMFGTKMQKRRKKIVTDSRRHSVLRTGQIL